MNEKLSQALFEGIDDPNLTFQEKRVRLKSLLLKGADINYQSGHLKSTVLHIVCGLSSLSDETRLKLVELLIKEGANPNMRDERGRTPLHLAGMNNYKEIYDYLVSKGADKTITYEYAIKKFKSAEDSFKDAKALAEHRTARGQAIDISDTVKNMQKVSAMLNESMKDNSRYFKDNSIFMTMIGIENKNKLKAFSTSLLELLDSIRSTEYGKYVKDGFIGAVINLKDSPRDMQILFNNFPKVEELFRKNMSLIQTLNTQFEKIHQTNIPKTPTRPLPQPKKRPANKKTQQYTTLPPERALQYTTLPPEPAQTGVKIQPNIPSVQKKPSAKKKPLQYTQLPPENAPEPDKQPAKSQTNNNSTSQKRPKN